MGRRRHKVAAGLVTAGLVASGVLTGSGIFVEAAPVGAGFTIDAGDLRPSSSRSKSPRPTRPVAISSAPGRCRSTSVDFRSAFAPSMEPKPPDARRDQLRRGGSNLPASGQLRVSRRRADGPPGPDPPRDRRATTRPRDSFRFAAAHHQQPDRRSNRDEPRGGRRGAGRMPRSTDRHHLHPQRRVRRRALSAVQLDVHVLRPVLRPWPGPREQRRQRRGVRPAAV